MSSIMDETPNKREGAFIGDDFEWKDPRYDAAEVDAFFEKLGPHVKRLEKFYNDIYAFIQPEAEDILLNPYTVIQIIEAWRKKAEKWDKLPMQLLDLMVPEGPGRDPKQIGIHNTVVGAVIHLLETSEMPNLKNMKFEPGNIRKIINEKPETWTNLVEAVQAARDNLYEALPTGDIDAFELLKVVKSHVKELDAITETKT